MARLTSRQHVILGALAALVPAVFLLAAASGSLHLGVGELWSALTSPERSDVADIVWELRLARAATAFTVGAALALAGALMQVLLRNPLADPYVLGLSGGAATGALTVMLLGAAAAWLAVGAFGGALLAAVLVFGLARGEGAWTPTRLLLNGIILAAGWSALVSFLLTVGPPRELRGMLFWLMGDLSGAGAPPAIAVIAIAVGLALATALGRALNILGRGRLQAEALGVGVPRLRIAVFVLASLLTAVAVTLAGSVGFVGLVVPHLLRLALGSDNRVILPASALAGGVFLVVADTLARSLFAPQQLPVGVLSAMIGVPIFLLLLRRTAARGEQ